ncbi:GNAT family N-acetyltransferase [Streptomyces sp. NPDC004539]|uniref:GNAT family N-acetyltransferase n=1 Tax=Streptomyces sp. NPDC004539 TaxID=3154280 RepID=UPI0033AF9302
MHLRPATPTDRPTIDRLWLMFRHDLSEFHNTLPFEDGTFRSERVDSAFQDPGWSPYLLTLDNRPTGMAFVRGLDGPTAVMNTFFVVRAARRRGHGLKTALEVITRHPGPWEIPFQETNTKAATFWRRVATAAAGTHWTEEHREAPDTWISFNTAHTKPTNTR